MKDTLDWISFSPDYPYVAELEALYTVSFPDSERKPFEMIRKGMEEGKMRGWILQANGKLAGLAFVIDGDEAAVLDYLAVAEEFQSRGYGSWMLKKLKDTLSLPIIVEIESTKDPAADPQTHRRKNFYLRNGFKDCCTLVSLFGVEMELLSLERPVTFEDYQKVMATYFGRELPQFIRLLARE